MSYISQGTVLTIERFDQRGMNAALACALTLLAAITTWWGGLLILMVGMLLGSAAQIAGARQAQLMGFLLGPVLLYLSGYQAQVVTALALDARLSVPPTTSAVEILRSVGLSLLAGVAVYHAWTTLLGRRA